MLETALARPGRCLFLTGAGISAESGIPTFRGPEGYWRVGSRNYHPEQLATRAAFDAMPATVWGWYLHRYRTCTQAHPNAAHQALVQAAQLLGERFLLITQNVDGLHRRAGSPAAQTYEIHGNIAYARCSADCAGLSPVSGLLDRFPTEAEPRELPAAFHCAGCGARLRPHVLWFDEFYDEPLFRLESSRRAAASAALLVVIGTTGATSLPLQIGELAARSDCPLVVINPEPNPFS
ncbi:MAG: Sir2 family NAD-dependent protein deacetylase, partial [Deltaproteobacteria bacterium]